MSPVKGDIYILTLFACPILSWELQVVDGLVIQDILQPKHNK